MTLADVVITGYTTVEDALRLTGSVEDAGEHPIAQAIAAGARDRGAQLARVESFTNSQGLGVQGIVDGHAVVAGRERFLTAWSMTMPDDLRGAMDAAEAMAFSSVFVVTNSLRLRRFRAGIRPQGPPVTAHAPRLIERHFSSVLFERGGRRLASGEGEPRISVVPTQSGARRLDCLLPARIVSRNRPLPTSIQVGAGDGMDTHKHPRANWKQIRRQYLDTGWWPYEGDVVLLNPAAMRVTRYPYRGRRIASP